MPRVKPIPRHKSALPKRNGVTAALAPLDPSAALGLAPWETAMLSTPEAHAQFEGAALPPPPPAHEPFALPWEKGRAAIDEAKRRIAEITAEVEVGKVYEGPITKILDFGALVNLLPGKDGLLHISQIAHERVEKVSDYLSEGQIVKVKVLETDEKGRVKLSMKALLDRPSHGGAEQQQQQQQQ